MNNKPDNITYKDKFGFTHNETRAQVQEKLEEAKTKLRAAIFYADQDEVGNNSDYFKEYDDEIDRLKKVLDE